MGGTYHYNRFIFDRRSFDQCKDIFRLAKSMYHFTMWNSSTSVGSRNCKNHAIYKKNIYNYG